MRLQDPRTTQGGEQLFEELGRDVPRLGDDDEGDRRVALALSEFDESPDRVLALRGDVHAVSVASDGRRDKKNPEWIGLV